MKHAYPLSMLTATVLMAASASVAAYAAPLAPENVKADVTGTRVDLSWSNGDAGPALLDCGFEEESFPADGWSARVTNDYAYLCSWFHYPSDDFLQTNNWEDYIRSGRHSAMMYFDMYGMKGDHNPAQDEWLITPPLDGAAYLELYYYIDPTVLEYGADENFPDHYYVKASYDGGDSWEILWDAREEASPKLGWHNLALPLGSGDAPAKVAFQGVSDSGEMVHFLWAIDDVKVLSSRSGSDTVEGYTIRLDGETVAEHVKSLAYTDVTPKQAGTHRYEIFAEHDGSLSEAASVDVEIAEIELLPPSEVRITSDYDDMSESYIVSIDWDAPVGGAIDPVYYNVYCDGAQAGTMLEETSMEFFGYTKGIYDFRVTAVYENPDGESEQVGERIAIDTRFNARDLSAAAAGSDVALRWTSPEPSDAEVAHYEIWRADRCVAREVKATEFTDTDVPAGEYRYYVNTVYADGVEALPAYLDVTTGESLPRALPFAEGFESGHLPADWRVSNLWEGTPDNLLWQFDDPNALGVSGEGFDGGFASIDCVNSGFYYLVGALVTPPIDVTDCTLPKLALTYTYDYASDGESTKATLELEKDGSGVWTPLTELLPYTPSEDQEQPAFRPMTDTVELGEAASGASSIRLRWCYDGMFDYHLALDNISVNDGRAGIDGVTAADVNVMAIPGGVAVSASEGIVGVEIYAADGRLIGSADGGGRTSVVIPLVGQQVCILRVATATTAATFKTAL